MTPLVSVWYCRQPGGPASSLPQTCWVTAMVGRKRGIFISQLPHEAIVLVDLPFMSHEREKGEEPMLKAALLHWSLASTMTFIYIYNYFIKCRRRILLRSSDTHCAAPC